MSDGVDAAIADFAAHLVPEAFSTPSSAYRVEVLPQPNRRGALAEWIDRCRHDAVRARYPFGGSPRGVVFVQRRSERWRWDQEPCCELEWLTSRVNREVAEFPAPWVYVCSLSGRDTAVATAGDGADLAAITWQLPWFAEARSPQVARVYTGMYELCGEEIVGQAPLPERTRFERAARRVLVRHPSRREHRLR